jgi:hypothetical protein
MKNGNEGMPVATVGEMRYGQNFIKKFLRSCETPIVITKNDTPEIALEFTHFSNDKMSLTPINKG